MILSKAPFRVSFFGGGTDYPSYYLEHGGSVISSAINKYLCIILRKSTLYSKYKYILKYSKIETVNEIHEIEHPAIREVLKYFNIDFGVELHVVADLPARTGLGSSSSFTVAMIAAVQKLLNIKASADDIGRTAIEIEQKIICEKVGSQDQMAAALGGFNKIDFLPKGHIKHSPIYLTEAVRHSLFRSMRLIYTNIQRSSSSVTDQQIKNTKKGTIDLYLSRLKSLTEKVYQDLLKNDISNLGECLNEAWELKKNFTTNITNNDIDKIYTKGLTAGAQGGKLLGAGNGGFLLFIVPEDALEQFEHSFSDQIIQKIASSSCGVEAKDIDI